MAPLVVIGGPGTGKTTFLAKRLAAAVDAAVAPGSVLVLTPTRAQAVRLRSLVEGLAADPFEGLSIQSFHGFAARLLQAEAPALGLDPFLEPVGRDQRLAMLLARFDELRLREHQSRGEPARLIASFIARIDALKAELKTPTELQAEALELERAAGDEAHATAARMEREFAAAFAKHDLILREAGAVDEGELLMEAIGLLRRRPDVRRRLRAEFAEVLVDDIDRASSAQVTLLEELLAGEGAHDLVATASTEPAVLALETGMPAKLVLEESQRCGADVLDAARAVLATAGGTIVSTRPAPGGEVRFWQCESERAQAQAVAREVSGLLARGVAPEGVCVLVEAPARHGQPIAAALDEEAVPHQLLGAGELLRRPEIRDLIAWLRLLADPSDSGAAVRALTRPPVGLRSIDLARVTTIARRRKLDMLAALRAALESPQLPPEARDRITSFLELYGAAAAALDEMRPDVFVHRLTRRVGIRRQQLFAAQPQAVARLVNVARLAELASEWSATNPHGSTREFIAYLSAVADSGLGPDAAPAGRGRGVTIAAIDGVVPGSSYEHVYVLGLHATCAVAPDDLATAMTRAGDSLVLSWAAMAGGGPTRPSPLYESARAALGGQQQAVAEELFGPGEGLHATLRLVRDEVLDTVSQVGGGLSEMRLDTHMDLNRAVARYLELIKVAALLQRPPGHALDDALRTVNELLGKVATPEQLAALDASALDEFLLDTDAGERRRRSAMRARHEPSLEAFIPRRGEGLALSATDIDAYRTCPLRYKFARVFSIPKEPTIHQRFGIVIHQVLERFHQGAGEGVEPGGGLGRILALFDASWRRSGFGTTDDELQLRDKAIAALTRFLERHREEAPDPVWFERSFAFRIGPHHLRGRIDRVDRLPSGGYELIDYKTGRPRSPEELRDDLQLSLYGMGAKEAWEVDPEAQSYYYVLDDRKVAVQPGPEESARVEQVVMEIGEGILDQDFEPTPSPEACGRCDYRLVCPAAEA
jgi:DNA helicase-2/ATP-dependent DNA helicase PcrA